MAEQELAANADDLGLCHALRRAAENSQAEVVQRLLDERAAVDGLPRSDVKKLMDPSAGPVSIRCSQALLDDDCNLDAALQASEETEQTNNNTDTESEHAIRRLDEMEGSEVDDNDEDEDALDGED